MKLVHDRFQELGFPQGVDINQTRMKEQLIAFIPGLREDKVGREVVLTFDGDVRNAVVTASRNPTYIRD